jgi:hypothetical protein
MDNSLGDLRTHPAHNAVGAHEPGGCDGLEQMLGDERVDGGHAGDVNDGDRRARLHDPLQEVLHDHLSTR